jgi:hypothetical protein
VPPLFVPVVAMMLVNDRVAPSATDQPDIDREDGDEGDAQRVADGAAGQAMERRTEGQLTQRRPACVHSSAPSRRDDYQTRNAF